MPGVKGFESGELRLGEARIETVKEIDEKAEPFIHPVLPMGNDGISAGYQAPKPEGLKNFLEIGERGGSPEAQLADKLQRYDLSMDRPLSREAINPGPMDFPPAEISGARSLLQNVSYYFKKTIDLWFGAMGGGLGGPMMIFGFLLGPKGSGGEGSGSPINIKLSRDFEEKVRADFAKLNQEGFFRDSPTSPLQNTQALYLTFDPQSSEPVLSPYPIENSINIFAHLDHRNVIFLDPQTLQGIRGYLKDASLNETQHSVLWGLTRLQGTKVYLDGAKGSEIPSPANVTDLLPKVDPKQIDTIRKYIRGDPQSFNMALMATIQVSGNPLKMAVMPSLEIFVGEMYFDPKGNITGLDLGRPAHNSPRGTSYQKGKLQGTPVRVVVDASGTLIHYEKISAPGLPELNVHQDAVLQAYMNSAKNQEARTKALDRHPMLADFALNHGDVVGAFDSLNSIMDARGGDHFQATLFFDGGRYFFSRIQGAGWRPTAAQPVAILEINYQPGKINPFRPENGEAGKFQVSVLQGRLPPKIEELLGFLHKVIERK